MEIFKSLQPYSAYLLIVAIVFILVGIAGGGRVKIREFSVGELTRAARLLAIIFGLAFGVMFFLIPPAGNGEPSYFDVSGKYIPGPWPELLEEDLEIVLVPSDKEYKTPVSHDGSFEFHKSQKIPEGTYMLSVRSERGKIDTETVFIEEGEEIIIEKLADREIRISHGSLFDHLVKKYKRCDTWQDKVQAINQLVQVASRDETLKKELQNALDGTDEGYKDLSIFVLGDLGETAARPLLEQIMKSDDNMFRRLRAAWLLMGFADSQAEAATFLFDVVNNQSLTRAERAVAALNLSKRGVRKTCVIERLIEGLQSHYKEVRKIIARSLSNITDQDYQEDYERWKEWWKNNKTNFRPC